MSRIKKLTPGVLKRIIREEKTRLSEKNKLRKNKGDISDSDIKELRKLTLQEAKALLIVKKIRTKRLQVEKKLKRR